MWSTKTWDAAAPTFHAITQHNFVQELLKGSLPQATFEFYIQQDALYLAEYGKTLAAIASKLDEATDAQKFLSFAQDTMLVERALHAQYLGAFKTQQAVTASPTCLLYTSYLHSLTGQKPIYEILAGVLPCFWIYQKVGDYILTHQSSKNNPYQAWIDTYGGAEFAQAVTQAIDICDRMAAQCTPLQQAKMRDAFVMATKMEWLFWDSAYQRESWKI